MSADQILNPEGSAGSLASTRDVLGDPRRLAALRRSRLLRDELNDDLDGLIKITATLLATPVAMLSLVDQDHQYLKSHVGLEGILEGRQKTGLSHSFCQWVVSRGDALIVEDARDHPVLSKSIAVRNLGVVAYAGTPVGSMSGHALGSICAIDIKPRRWTQEEIAILRNLSHLIDAQAVDGACERGADARWVAQHLTLHGIRAGLWLLRNPRTRQSEDFETQLLALTDRLSERLLALMD